MADSLKRFFVLMLTGIFVIPAVFSQTAGNASKAGSAVPGQQVSSENSVPEGSDASVTEEAWQILEWEEDEPLFVLKYQVVIEQFNPKKKKYTEINRLMTEDNTTHVQVKPYLAPGTYRFKVITYNLIGVPEVESDWMGFNIYQAYQPAVSNVSVDVNKSGTIYLDEINDGKITVSGKNLFTGPENDQDLSFTEYYMESNNGKKSFVPEITEYSDSSKKLSVQLNMKDIDIGKYYFVAKDASGLKNEKNADSQLTVKFKKRVDFDLSAGYACPVVLFDKTIETYMESNIWPLSGVARMSFIPFKHRYGFFGLGLSAGYSRMFLEKSNYSVDGNLIFGHLNFIYQLPFYTKPDKDFKRRHIMNLEVHGGAGVTFFNSFAFHFPHDINTDPFNSLNLSVDAGALAQIYFTQRMFIEPCVDYVMTLSTVNTYGMLVPSISIGRQF